MCQSANRFSRTSLMCPSAWPGCLSSLSASCCSNADASCERRAPNEQSRPLAAFALRHTHTNTHTHAKRTALQSSAGRSPDPVCFRRGFRCSGKELNFYFPRALNSIQPLLPKGRLGVMQPDNTKVSRIIDYLADRPQFVPCRSTLLDLRQQRGIVLSALFTASDCRLGSESHPTGCSVAHVVCFAALSSSCTIVSLLKA